MDQKDYVSEVFARLISVYPDPKTALIFTTPFQLLIATILSAQTTDKLVNTVTPALFERFPTVSSLAEASEEEIQGYINKVNFYRNKAKAIKACAQVLVSYYHSEVPHTMEELDSLPGVARKTANVVLGNAFGIAHGVVVDTHVRRVSQRLGLTKQEDPVKIEQDLLQIVPEEKRIDFSHLFIEHGRSICKAPRPKCPECVLKDICPSAQRFYPELQTNP